MLAQAAAVEVDRPVAVPVRVHQAARLLQHGPLRAGQRQTRSPRLHHDQVLVGMLEKISQERLARICQVRLLAK